MSGDELRRQYKLRADLEKQLRTVAKSCGDEPSLLAYRADIERILLGLVQRNRQQRAHVGAWIAGAK